MVYFDSDSDSDPISATMLSILPGVMLGSLVKKGALVSLFIVIIILFQQLNRIGIVKM